MWSDKESEIDYLNFGEVSKVAVDILTSPGMLPVSVGVFGNWGAGKSSLLKLIERDLQQGGDKYLVVYFDAWLYQGYDDARAALLEVIARALDKAAKDNETLLKKTKSLLSRVNGFRVLGLVAEGAALAFGVPTGGMLARGIGAAGKLVECVEGETAYTGEDYQELQKAAGDAKAETEGLLKKTSKASPPQQIDAFRREYGEILKELGKPLIVTIDNLDRCLPTNAIHTLEAIRLFLFLPNTAFVIAADEEMIRSAVAEYFKGTSKRHQIDYLDKLIQVPIGVPRVGVREIRAYLFMLFAIDHGVSTADLERLRNGLEESLQQSWQDDPISKEAALKLTGSAEKPELVSTFGLADRIAPILATSPIIHGNPRIVKRLLNVVKMRSQIARRRKMPLDESVITKLVIFERCAGVDATADLYRLIDEEAGKPELLARLETAHGTSIPEDSPNSWKDNPATKDFIQKWSKLDPPLKNVDLRAAVYLSRETMPIGVYVVGLSPKGREALQALVSVNKISSPVGQETAEGVAFVEQVPVMEGIVDHLRQIPDWTKQPDGFAGACLLARKSADAAAVLKRFVSGIEQRPWMKTMLKNEPWFKE